MAEALPIGYVGNLALGATLWVLAGAVARGHRRGPGRLPLAVFLALVGANYVLDGFRVMALFADLRDLAGLLDRAASVFGALDPPFLLLFAMAEVGHALRARTVALVLLPSLALNLLAPGGVFGTYLAREAYTLMLAAYYVGAFALLARGRLGESDPARGGRLDVLLLALGPIVLARLPLLYIDLGTIWGPEGRADPRTLVMEGGLVLVYLAAAGLLMGADRSPGRETSKALLLPLAALLAVVALIWGLRFVPALQETVFAYLYSVRWFLFLAVLVRASNRERLLEARPGAGRVLPVTFAALLLATAVASSSSLVAALSETSLPEAFFSGCAIVGSGLVILVAIRLALPGPRDALASRRLSLYRAQVDLGASPGELERLRQELGLTVRAAREVESMAALERRLPSSGGPEPGKVFLGRYRVEGIVGVGTFGRVWAAEDLGAGGRVVLKELREEWRQDPRALRRFVGEIRSAMRIRHPNLVAFRALERYPGGFVLVLDRVEGETLRARLSRGPLPEAETARLALDLAHGLAALHAAGIVHRDVKPENVVLRPDGSAVLLDLGAAADATRGGTVPDAPLGTPAYMAPEQARGEGGPPADVYALAVVLWEAVAGAPPPSGTVPAAWRGFLARALDPDPSRRFPDAADASRALPAQGGLAT